jgi:mannose-6-phosphate isomerase-like protein (cupin superfamily)
MSIAYLAQAGQQQQLEWLAGGTLSILLDSAATKGQLLVARSRTSEGVASPYHMHTREDEVFMMISGAARFWCGEEESELAEGGIIFLPKNVPHAYRLTSATAEMLIICTPGGNEGLYRYAGRDRATKRPDGWTITPERLAEGATIVGNVVLGPPR